MVHDKEQKRKEYPRNYYKPKNVKFFELSQVKQLSQLISYLL